MKCPACQSHLIARSPHRLLHYLRAFIGSDKYHCLSCAKKWRASPKGGRSKRKSAAISFLVLMAGFFVYVLVDHGASHFLKKSSDAEDSGMMEIVKDPVLAGKLMRAGSDPSVLKNLKPSEKKKLSSLKKHIFNNPNDKKTLAVVAQFVGGDTSLASKIAQSKGDPAMLRNLSAADKQKLKDLKERLSSSEIQQLKSQYGK